MEGLLVNFRRIEFKCSKCKVRAESHCVEGVLERLVCPCCSRVVLGRRGAEMFREEFDYFVAEEKKSGVFGALKVAGVQSGTHTFPELFRPEWEFCVERNEYLIALIHHFIHE